MIATDIEGNVLIVGDQVYYARKRNHTANGELVKCTVTKIKASSWGEPTVSLGKYQSTSPSTQLIKIK